jgi:hypothetical protein
VARSGGLGLAVRNKLAISDERLGVRDKIERKRVREMSERENP